MSFLNGLLDISTETIVRPLAGGLSAMLYFKFVEGKPLNKDLLEKSGWFAGAVLGSDLLSGYVKDKLDLKQGGAISAGSDILIEPLLTSGFVMVFQRVTPKAKLADGALKTIALASTLDASSAFLVQPIKSLIS